MILSKVDTLSDSNNRSKLLGRRDPPEVFNIDTCRRHGSEDIQLQDFEVTSSDSTMDNRMRREKVDFVRCGR
jgi:hypothetical protein